MDKSSIEITNDPYFKNFIKTKNLSESSERVYFGRLKAFCDFLGKNPSDLINEVQKASNDKINGYFNDYIKNLIESGKSSNTITNRLDTVKAFYKEYDIDIEILDKIISPNGYNFSANDIITEVQIKEAIELSSLRDKAIILLHISSGMEATELRHLTYGDFINSIEEYIDLKSEEIFDIENIADILFKMDEIVSTWKIEKNRTGKSYVTFSTPESIKAILSYLLDRKRKNKAIKSLNEPLFVNSHNQQLNISAHGAIFKRINKRANFGYITKKRRFFSSTMLRKYFKTQLYESGVDETTIKAILGQNLDVNIDYHSNYEIKLLKTDYMDVLEYISIDKSDVKVVTSKEYNNLIQKLKEKDKELESIKIHLNHIKQIIE